MQDKMIKEDNNMNNDVEQLDKKIEGINQKIEKEVFDLGIQNYKQFKKIQKLLLINLFFSIVVVILIIALITR